MKQLEQLIRPDLLNLKPYSSARDDFKGTAEVFVDANENPFENEVNRYPDPKQRLLKKKISDIKGVAADRIFLGNGSDEVLDLIFRLFCVPGKDEVIITPPTYGMYKVLAGVNNVFVKEVHLDESFQLDELVVLKRYDRETKILFLCSPNNPVGVSLDRTTVERIIDNFPGIVVIDEAYIDFSDQKSFLDLIDDKANLIVVQTLSKAWGMAGIRLGMAFSNPYIISQLDKIKPPYNVNVLTQKAALERLDLLDQFRNNVSIILKERKRLRSELSKLNAVIKIHPSEANFLLIQFKDPSNIYKHLLDKGIVVRDRSNQPGCQGCLRITVGTPEENNQIIEFLSK